MSVVSEQIYRETLVNSPVIEGDPNNTSNALKQIEAFAQYFMDEGKATYEDAMKFYLAASVDAAEKNGKDYRKIWDNYPPEIKAKFPFYDPTDLETAQQTTAAGTSAAMKLNTLSIVFAGIAVGVSILYPAFVPAAIRIAAPVAIPAFTAYALKQIASNITTQINNFNDVQHWGPLILQGQIMDIEKAARQMAGLSGTGGFTKSEPASYTRVNTSKTAKPKLFTGTFFSGKLGKFDEFVRQVDDRIDSFSDMIDDLEINLKRWYEKLPGMLNYDLVVVNQPKDELGMTKTGTWVVCNLYLTNSWHKRMLLENILLGPVDPAVYYPDTQTVYSINLSVPKILKPQDIEKLELPSGREYTVDKDGNVVAGFFGGYGTKIQGGDVVGTANKIVEASKEIAKATEKAAEQKSANVPAGHIEIPEGTQAIDKKTGGFLYSTGKGAILKESDILQRNGREIDTYGIKYVFPAGYVPPTAQVAGASTQAPQTPAPATGATPPVSQGTNLVQPFPRTIVVRVNGLAVRSAPNTSAPLAGSQRLNSGDRFVATALVTGEMVEGVNLWWRSEFGNYVWSGGTQ